MQEVLTKEYESRQLNDDPIIDVAVFCQALLTAISFCISSNSPMVMDKQTDRRELLTAAGMGLAGLEAALTMKENKLLANPAKPDLVGRSFDTIEKPAKPAKAKSMISLWMQGGPAKLICSTPKKN